MFVPSTITKAITGGIVSALVAEGARYGFQSNATTVTALGVVVTAIIGYVIGHLIVFLVPANKQVEVAKLESEL